MYSNEKAAPADLPEAEDEVGSSSEEPTKSYREGKDESKRNPPKQEFTTGERVRYVDSQGKSHDCKVDQAKLERSGWTYSLVETTIDEAPHKGGAFIREADLVGC